MRKRIKIIPYTTIDGIFTFRDSDIMALYERTEADGTCKTVFCDGSIGSKEQFLACMKGNSELYVIFLDDKICGFTWLNRFEGRFARMHWCLFKEVWGKESVEIGRYVVDVLINSKDKKGKYWLDMLVGYIPVSNAIAITFVKKVGGIFAGELPCGAYNRGKSEAAAIVYYVRDDHEDTRQNDIPVE